MTPPRLNEGSEREALVAFLEAQDALDNREFQGQNAEDYFVMLRRRNLARDDLDAALSASKQEGKAEGWEELFAAADEALELTRLHGGPQLPRLFEAVRTIQCNQSGG